MIKADRRGRLRNAQEQKGKMVAADLISGLSAPRFAKLHGVNYQTLVCWIKKGNTAGSPNKSPSQEQPGQVPASLDYAGPGSGVVALCRDKLVDGEFAVRAGEFRSTMESGRLNKCRVISDQER
jgi:hypothetical protein